MTVISANDIAQSVKCLCVVFHVTWFSSCVFVFKSNSMNILNFHEKNDFTAVSFLLL